MEEIIEQADSWLERWKNLSTNEKQLLKDLSRKVAHDAVAYGGRGQRWQDWDEQEKHWHALSPVAQALCEEAREIWSPLLRAIRKEAYEAGIRRAHRMTPDELLAHDDSRWKIWEAATAACWGPCEKPE